MSELRVLIADDEPLARRGIRQMLANEPDVVIVCECANGRQAVEAVRDHAPDLVFLDVQMPDLDGLGVIREIGVDRMPPVVFVTAYDEFAVRAFEAHALDYLVKPLNSARFAATMRRVRERRHAGALVRWAAELADALPAFAVMTEDQLRLPSGGPLPRAYADRLVVTTAHGGNRVISVDTIDWIEADDYYARLHVGRSHHLLRESLSRLARRLDPALFLRVHRSAIVRLDRVQEIVGAGARTRVILRDGTRIPVSRRRAPLLRARIRTAKDRR